MDGIHRLKRIILYLFAITIIAPLQISNFNTNGWWDRNELVWVPLMPLAEVLICYCLSWFNDKNLKPIESTFLYSTGIFIPITWWADIAIPSGYTVYESLEKPIGLMGVALLFLNVLVIMSLYAQIRRKEMRYAPIAL